MTQIQPNERPIAANELRIGNWLLDDQGVPRQVDYIGDTIGLKNDTGGTDKYQSNPLISHDINSLKPIPLTPDVLERCGFTHTTDMRITTYNYDINPITKDWLLTLKWIEGLKAPFFRNGYFEIYSLHQLQNLFYALTGTELNYKL